MLELEKKFLKTKLGSIISFSVDLKEFSTIKIGTIAFAVCKPKNEKELKLCIKTLKAIGLKFRIIGNCSNILFSSNLSHLVLISTVELIGVKIDIKKQELTACCGEKLSTCFSKARDLGLSGFESLAFIPATVGGAIVNNAGAFNVEIKDILESVRVLTSSGRAKTIKASELNLMYRSSDVKKMDYIIISAVFRLKFLAPSVITHIAGENLKRRLELQPSGFSLGSVFKKVNGVSAGKYIDDAGLKGVKVGGCIVSPKHANFILNIGGATQSDFKKLVRLIKKEVYKKFKVNLETEVEYL